MLNGMMAIDRFNYSHAGTDFHILIPAARYTESKSNVIKPFYTPYNKYIHIPISRPPNIHNLTDAARYMGHNNIPQRSIALLLGLLTVYFKYTLPSFLNPYQI
jgi:hypothetical protein